MTPLAPSTSLPIFLPIQHTYSAHEKAAGYNGGDDGNKDISQALDGPLENILLSGGGSLDLFLGGGKRKGTCAMDYKKTAQEIYEKVGKKENLVIQNLPLSRVLNPVQQPHYSFLGHLCNGLGYTA